VETQLSPRGLTREVLALGRGDYLADPFDILARGLDLFKPPSRISTVEWAEKYRKFRTPEGGALVPYDRKRTPYNVAKMDALDDPSVNLVIIVKPSRSGGTTICENYLGKLIQFGPMGDVGWYLGSGEAVKAYVERVIKPMFEDHPDLQAKVGSGRSEDNDRSKRINGHLVEWMPASDSFFRNREFVFGVMDEPDGWSKFSETPEIQLEGRQKNIGRRRKGVILSHPDKGWKAGVAAAWESSSRGIYIMRCAECGRFASAHSTKFWPDVPEFKVEYDRNKRASPDERLDMAERTAGMACPHCGAVLSDEQRFAMVDEAGENGWWMHRGQTLDIDRGIQGEPDTHTKRGFYDHGLMLKVSPARELARGMEEALMKFERSNGSRAATKGLREFMSKQLGEIFEGKAGIAGVDSAQLQKRAKQEDAATMGMFPAQGLFLVAAVDVGLAKFDVSFRAFDLEGRSWWLDRLTIRQRRWPDGQVRDIRTRDRIEDWQVLIDKVLTRTFPIEGRENLAMPVACMTVDVGDGNVVWKGREFARRSLLDGHYWGAASNPWAKVRLIQGSPSAKAPELPIRPREISKDEEGRKMSPTVLEYTLGAHKLKELALERLAVNDGGPGQCLFAPDIASNYYDEYFNEPLVDGKFERIGPNESLDLFGYEEAARLMLQPDRKDITWDDETRRPPWARPVVLFEEGGDQAAPVEAGRGGRNKDILAKFGSLNNNRRN